MRSAPRAPVPSGRRLAGHLPVVLPALEGSRFVSSFLRGLTAGALIGAALAGSAVLQRRRSKRDEVEPVLES